MSIRERRERKYPYNMNRYPEVVTTMVTNTYEDVINLYQAFARAAATGNTMQYERLKQKLEKLGLEGLSARKIRKRKLSPEERRRLKRIEDEIIVLAKRYAPGTETTILENKTDAEKEALLKRMAEVATTVPPNQRRNAMAKVIELATLPVPIPENAVRALLEKQSAEYRKIMANPQEAGAPDNIAIDTNIGGSHIDRSGLSDTGRSVTASVPSGTKDLFISMRPAFRGMEGFKEVEFTTSPPQNLIQSVQPPISVFPQEGSGLIRVSNDIGRGRMRGNRMIRMY